MRNHDRSRRVLRRQGCRGDGRSIGRRPCSGRDHAPLRREAGRPRRFQRREHGRETARLNEAHPGKVLGVHCDVTSEKDVQDMIKRAADFGAGRIDLLFNNAGAGLGGSFDEQSNEDWDRAFALNFYGALYGIRAVLPVMRAQGSGHIIDVISGIAFYPMAYQSKYSATKAALNGLTLSLRYELWDENIRVSSATPGTTATPIWESGGVKPPANAQSPEQSAQTILAGVAANERLVPVS